MMIMGIRRGGLGESISSHVFYSFGDIASYLDMKPHEVDHIAGDQDEFEIGEYTFQVHMNPGIDLAEEVDQDEFMSDVFGDDIARGMRF